MTAPTYATGLSTAIYGGTSGLSNKHQPLCIQKFQYNVANFTGTTGQSVALINIPANTMVAFLEVYIQTALTFTGTPSVKVGDGTAIDTFVASDATLTAGHVYTQAITTNPLIYYSTANKLNLTLTAGSIFPGTGVLQFVIGLVDCTADAPMTTQ